MSGCRSCRYGHAVCLTARFILVVSFATAFPFNMGLQQSITSLTLGLRVVCRSGNLCYSDVLVTFRLTVSSAV